jgi:integrin beta 2
VFQILAKVTPQHPFDLAVYGDYIFWTDWVLHAVIRANKYTGEDVVWLRKEVPRPMGIIAVANDTNDCEFTENLTIKSRCSLHFFYG